MTALNQLLRACGLAAVAAFGLLVPAGADPGGLPHFDIQAEQRGTTLSRPDGDAGASLTGAAVFSRKLPGAIIQWDALTGSPSRVSHPTGPLTAPSRLPAERIARRFLGANPELFRLDDVEIGTLYKSREYSTPGLNITHVWLNQQYRGIPVFQADMGFHVGFSGELQTVNGSLVRRLSTTINTRTPRLNAYAALRAAAEYSGLRASVRLPGAISAPQGIRRSVVFGRGRIFDREPLVELIYFPTAKGRTSLAWETTLWQTGVSDVYHILVDATSGKLLFRKNYTNYAQGQVFDREAPQDGAPFTGATPAVRARVLKQFDGTGFFSAADVHFDWWAGAAKTITGCNNVFAGPFRDSSATTVTAVSAATGDFSFPLDLTQAPSTYQNAATTNLFYWNNLCHDLLYTFGFTEAAGNFQVNNFGLGGAGNDRVLALAQFGAADATPSRNNANFSTPPDGTSGTMRMFEFDLTNPLRDGDLGADVIVHEYGHGLSNRLVGNANGLTAFQSKSMGEGWSDYLALMVHALSADNVNGVYPIGGYLLNDFPAGIRSQPYSTQAAVFTRTYRSISDPSGSVHLAGEIMCNALWQVYGKLHARLGFTEGRKRAIQLFVDGLKLAPTNPTFLDYRDAFILADRNRFAGADVNDIWSAFALRGMGSAASTTGPEDKNPVESFAVPALGFTVSGTVTKNAVALAGVLVTATGTAPTSVTQTVSPNLAIPDNNTTGIQSNLVVTQTGTVTSVRVRAKITHTFRGDLEISLIHPDGVTKVKLKDVSDDANDNIDTSYPPTATAQALSAFNGKPVNGTWKLEVKDLGAVDTGTLNLFGLTLGYTGALTKQATTGSDGKYAIPDLLSATYTITPTKVGETFSPASTSLLVNADKPNTNFSAGAASFSVAGKVLNANGTGLASVLVSAGGKTATSAADGSFTIAGVAAGTQTVTPTRSGFTFSPATRSVSISANVANLKFTGTAVFSISGTITGAGASGATVRATVAATHSQSAAGAAIPDNNTTGISPTMAVAPVGTVSSVKVSVDIAHTWRGDLEVSLIHPDGTTVKLFDGPRGDSTANLITSFPDQTASIQALTVLNGKACNGTWKLKVRDLAAADTGTLASWRLVLGINRNITQTATSATNGTYTITGLAAGVYTVKPTKTGATYTPATRVATIVNANVTGVNFTSTVPFAGPGMSPAGSGSRQAAVAIGSRPVGPSHRRPATRLAGGSGHRRRV